MSPELIFAVVAGAAGTGGLVWVALSGSDPARQRAVANLRRGLIAQPTGEVSARGPVASLARTVTPVRAVGLLERLMIRAGHPAGWTLDRLVSAKLVLALTFGLLSVALLSRHPGIGTGLLAVLVTGVAWCVPELLLYSRSTERAQKINTELADTLDQMTIAVEAGLGFDAAMERAGRNGTGPLAQELLRTLQDMQLGHSRREAYAALSARVDAPDLRRFVRAVTQGDKHGIAIADVLRTQAGEMRTKRRQRAEEKAMQIPVKVIFPLMLCILPVLFIVLLGPTVINVMGAFG